MILGVPAYVKCKLKLFKQGQWKGGGSGESFTNMPLYALFVDAKFTHVRECVL